MKKVSLLIGGKRYTIGLEDPFADEMEKELIELFETGRNNETVVLLEAFLKKQLELLEYNRKMEKLLEKVENFL